MTDRSLHDVPPGCFRPFAFAATAQSQALAPAGAIRLGGWSFLNTDPANPASVELWDGGAPGGGTVAVITLAAGQAVTTQLPGKGVLISSGLFLSVIAGTVRGAVWAAPAHLPDTYSAGQAAGQ